MPSLGWHLAISLFVISSFVDKNEWKKAVLLVPFGILSDIDAFIGIHRATLHNIFFILTPVLSFVALRAMLRVRGEVRKMQSFCYFCFASVLVALHVLLDAFHTGVFFFYPVVLSSYDLSFRLSVRETGLSTAIGCENVGKVGEVVYATVPSPGVPEIPLIGSGIEFVTFICALLVFALKFLPPVFRH